VTKSPARSTNASPWSVERTSTVRLILPGEPGEVQRAQEEVEAALLFHRFPPVDVVEIKLALGAALISAIKHGNRMDWLKKIWVFCRLDRDRFEVLITDEGDSFDLSALSQPPLDPEKLDPQRQQGLALIRDYMDEVVILPPGNTVLMTRLRSLTQIPDTPREYPPLPTDVMQHRAHPQPRPHPRPFDGEPASD